MAFLYYDTFTEKLVKTYQQPTDVAWLTEVPDDANVNDYVLQGEGAIVAPEKPGPWAMWDGEQWIDPRTPEDHEAAVQRIRNSASLTKLQFVMAVVNAGIISQASGLAMLDGTLPIELAGLTDSMTEMEKFELAAKLKGAQQIDRIDPFIIASGQFLGLTVEQMDSVFGITAPA